jgi:hypothetical protein
MANISIIQSQPTRSDTRVTRFPCEWISSRRASTSILSSDGTKVSFAFGNRRHGPVCSIHPSVFRLWDAKTGKVQMILKGHREAISKLFFTLSFSGLNYTFLFYTVTLFPFDFFSSPPAKRAGSRKNFLSNLC